MTKRTRTILFYICVFLFILVTPFVVLYSQGYRIDLNPPTGGEKITKTGGFFLKIEPKQAEIYINEKLIKKTDFFFGSVLIENLLPKKYDVSIKKEGYQDWEKNLEVKENLVTEAKNIVLIPKNLNFQVLAEGIKNSFLAPDERKMILKKENKDGWYISLFDLENNTESVLTEEKNLSQKKVDFLNLQWSSDSKKILLETAIAKNQKYFVFELENPTSVSPIPIDFLGIPEKISFDSGDSQKLFFQKEGSLFEIDYKIKIISEPILTDLMTYDIFENRIFGLDKSGLFFVYDPTNKSQEKLNIEPFSVKKDASYQIFLNLPEIFLKENNVLFRFNYNLKSFEKIFESVKDSKFSQDRKKLMLFNDYEVWVLYLKDILVESPKKAGDFQLISRFSEKINQVFWLTDYYLIFNFGDKIKVAEIDDRDKIQIWDLSSFKTPEIFWNQNNKELYILSEDNFYKSEKLIK